LSHPLLYEINTRCWLHDLTQRHGASITLANVPEVELSRWRDLGFTHVWLMGVWRIGPRSRSLSRQVPELRETSAKLLPDFSEEDLAGSPYAIAGYDVASELGGEEGLADFRKRLNAHGLKLILDFIPNHTGLDHPWVQKRPDLFVQSREYQPGTFRENTSAGPIWLAHGRDPNFHPWVDTAQLDYRNPATRAAMIEELRSIARRCDGVRCDMAMLLLHVVFARTWAEFPVQQPGKKLAAPSQEDSVPESEFWAEAIRAIKAAEADFLFLAEVYWDLEPRLVNLGFDFAYDKRLTDNLVARDYAEVQRQLFSRGEKNLQASAHFLENHDEPRIATLLSVEEHRAAALLILGLPGLRLLHEGQLTGARIRVSVQLRRRPAESPQPDIAALYERFLTLLPKTVVGQGQGKLLKPIPAWESNRTFENVIVVQWQRRSGEFDLVVVNPASHTSQCYVKLTVDGLGEDDWEMINLLGPERFERNGRTLRQTGLYLKLPAHAAQLFHFQPKKNRSSG